MQGSGTCKGVGCVGELPAWIKFQKLRKLHNFNITDMNPFKQNDQIEL